MRTLLRGCLIGVLIASLAEAPVFASPSPALGVIVQAERARVGSGDAVGGATVFDGDTLVTSSAGTLHVRLGAAQLYLLADSSATIRERTAGVIAVLARGTAVFSSASAEAIELRASEARIRPRTAQPTYGQVTVVGPCELLVTSQRGQLEVAIGDEVHTVPEATSYRVLIEPEKPSSQGPGRPPAVAARSRFLLVALIAIGVGTGIGIWRALVSPDQP